MQGNNAQFVLTVLVLFSFNFKPPCCLVCSNHCRFLMRSVTFFSRPNQLENHSVCVGGTMIYKLRAAHATKCLKSQQK